MAARARCGFNLESLVWLLLAAGGSALAADTWTVDITADENDAGCAVGDCSLREALAVAADGDTIAFALPGPSPWTITISSALGQLVIVDDLTITGPGSSDLALSGGDARRVLSIEAPAAVVMSGVTIRDGRAHSSGDKHGGCVRVLGSLTISSSRFEGCDAWDGGLTSNTEGGDGGAIFVASGGAFDGDLLEIVANDAGLGGGPSGLPPGFRGGRGGGLANAGTATLRRSTVSDCDAGAGQGPSAPGGHGGGLANLAGGALRIDDSTLVGNRSGDGGTFMGQTGADGSGGGLYCEADCTVNNVTLSGNAIGATATGTAAQGGGLFVAGGTTRLRNVTVAGNTASGNGGGIARSAGTLRPRNSTISGNAGLGNNDDCFTSAAGGLVSEGYNLVRVNNGCASSFIVTDQVGNITTPLEPLLGALADNGGPTDTHALGAGSPAIDGGDPAGCLAWNGTIDIAMPFDQRGSGFPRAIDGDGDLEADCDAGAFEAPEVPPVEHDLDVAVTGAAGGGTVTSDPVGISCPADCTESYLFNEVVDLFATPNAGFVFTGWSGECTGVGACQVAMSADRSVTATFAELFDLTVSLLGGGSGSVESVPAGIDCPGVCTVAFVDGQQVSLSATPDAGSYFAGWGGECTGGTCQVTMSADRSVTATFEDLVGLTVALAGDGDGTVESVPAGIDCPGTCSAGFEIDESVTLTATPDPGSLFGGWSGDCSGSSCVLTMSVPRNVTATFLSTTVFVDGFESGGYCLWSGVVGAPTCLR